MTGKIIRSTGSWYEVELEDGQIIASRIKGKFRMEGFDLTNPVAVGDQVAIELEKSGHGVIKMIHDRRNYLVRRSPRKKHLRHIIASNLDQLIVMSSIKEPRTSEGFIDRCLLMATYYDIPAYVVINKSDLLDDDEKSKAELLQAVYNKLGYPCHIISVKNSNGIEEVNQLLKNKTTLITGHSGVGKSSYLNYILPDLELKTKEISEYTTKGQHATTFAEMYRLDADTYIIDTPGIKEFGVIGPEEDQLSFYFPEMADLKDECKFNNCLHINEPGCAITNAVEQDSIALSRYKSYLSILEDIQSSKSY